MIRNDTECQEASEKLRDELKRLGEHRARLKEAGLGDVEVKGVIDPLESFHLHLKEEVEAYERLKRGEFDELDNLRGVGHLLITSRIAQGISLVMAGTCGHREQTFPRKPIFTTILDIRCKILIYIDKVGRLGLEPRTKALKGPCSTN